MSKLSQLKQEAYQAGKKRDWDLAVSIYEQILEIDKNNPMVINEMGDLCLKAGETPRAIRHFLNAAARYRTTGLLNNAVAIYKKILRYDSDNQGAHWYLAETRASQDLLVEGQEHAIQFLENSERVSGDLKEIFLKRCLKLFELYSTSRPILDRLLAVFRMWEMNLESARTSCLLACFTFTEGDAEAAKKAMKEIPAKVPEVRNYPEFQRLVRLIDPGSVAKRIVADVNAISFDAPEPAAEQAAPATPGPGSYGVAEIEVPDETAFPFASPDVREDPGAGGEPEVDEEICYEVSLDDGATSFEDLVAQAASGLGGGAVLRDESAGESAGKSDESDESAESVESVGELDGEPAVPVAKGDLLAQILAQDDGQPVRNESSQLAAITEDIGAQVGGADGQQNPASQYEMGLVYLDMGLFDQACDSFRLAARDAGFAMRSIEMLGITLLKARKPELAVQVLKEGLENNRSGSRERLGLQYHLGQAYEQAGQEEEAMALYQEIHRVDPRFLDVEARLATRSRV